MDANLTPETTTWVAPELREEAIVGATQFLNDGIGEDGRPYPSTNEAFIPS